MAEGFYIPELEPQKNYTKKIITVVVIIFVILVLAGAFTLRYFRRLNIPQDINIKNYSEYMQVRLSISSLNYDYFLDVRHYDLVIRNKNNKRLVEGFITVELYKNNVYEREYIVYFYVSPGETENYYLTEGSHSYRIEVVSVEGTAEYNG